MSQDLCYLLIQILSSAHSLLQQLRGDGHPDAEKEYRLHLFRALQAHQG